MFFSIMANNKKIYSSKTREDKQKQINHIENKKKTKKILQTVKIWMNKDFVEWFLVAFIH